MTPSPFARINAATLRADRRESRAALAALATAVALSVPVILLARMALHLAVHWPELAAQAAARAAG